MWGLAAQEETKAPTINEWIIFELKNIAGEEKLNIALRVLRIALEWVYMLKQGLVN